MLKTVFFYFDSIEAIINTSLFQQLKSTLTDLKKNNVTTVLLLPAYSKDKSSTWLDDIPTYSFAYTCSNHLFFSKEGVPTFYTLLQKLSVQKDELILVTDCFSFADAAKTEAIACIGLLHKNDTTQNLTPASVLIEDFQEINYKYFSNVLKRAAGIPLTIAQTKHFILRELSLEDIPDLYKLLHNPQIKSGLLEPPDKLTIMLEKHQAYIQNIYHFFDFGLWGIFQKETNNLIGQCGIQSTIIDGNCEIELGYLLSPDFWGMGYAKEAVKTVFRYAKNQLELTRIVAVIDKNNLASIQLAKSVGMKLEKEIFHKGEMRFLFSIFSPFIEKKNTNIPTKKYVAASQKVYEKARKNPDTSVYGKRYS